MEGGEFNALVSMKILNKAKKVDIQAEAKVAMNLGPVDLNAEANVAIARNNIETNTETTISVSWSGGGHIKPMEQQWDIQSLMQAAARFPDLVADCPQRTYAILSKYETLRSFVALMPANYTPLQYENAQIYTNALLDSFMGYKALYKQLGEQIFNVKGKTLVISPWDDNAANPSSTALAKDKANSDPKKGKPTKDEKTGLYPFEEDNTRFEASIKGLSDARAAIRRQMARIVNEVDAIEKDPKLATDEDHHEPFQSPDAFEARLPKVDIPAHLRRRKLPLSGKAIEPKKQNDEDEPAEKYQGELEESPELYNQDIQLSQDESRSMDLIREERLGIGRHFKITSAAGANEGKFFNHLEIIKPDWSPESIKIHIYKGFISYVGVTYDNGLLIGRGVVGYPSVSRLSTGYS